MEYLWTDATIRSKVRELKKLNDSVTDEEESKIIKAQIDYANNFMKHIHTDYRQPKLLEAYEELRNYVYREKFSWDILYDFCDNLQGGFSLITPSRLEISNDDILSITHDFYKTLSKDIFKVFLDCYNMRANHIRFDQKQSCKGASGYAYLFPSLGEYFVQITRNGSVEDIFTSIHESGHIIWEMFNRKYIWNANKYIEELIPYAMEMIASDYLEGIFGEQSLRHKALKHALSIMENEKWLTFMELVAIEQEEFGKFRSPRQLKQAGKMIGLASDELSSLLNLVNFPEMYRTVPYVYAIELYSMYKKDPDLACNVIKRIMEDETVKPEESLKMLEREGINANEHSGEFHQNLILSLKRNFPAQN